ncbi:protein YIF1B isoform X3 [Poecile atricapillus]|uniref:protein YIF1B isoform X3 n=1 Tax=Poecile atricapillus TaxID=48891 RepID=UPI0027382214|nr:protein YIF1B isoform X3 [Poecile atricapillus]
MAAAAAPPKRRGPARLADPRPLFEDTSAPGASPGRGFGAPPPPPPPSASSSSPGPAAPPFAAPGAFLAEPVSSLAAAYGSSWASHVEGSLCRWLPAGTLKYYFAVDTAYVGRKLRLLLFPFGHPDWQVRYQQDGPVAPRFDVNAPDLYIPAPCPSSRSHGLPHLHPAGRAGPGHPEQVFPGQPGAGSELSPGLAAAGGSHRAPGAAFGSGLVPAGPGRRRGARRVQIRGDDRGAAVGAAPGLCRVPRRPGLELPQHLHLHDPDAEAEAALGNLNRGDFGSF